MKIAYRQIFLPLVLVLAATMASNSGTWNCGVNKVQCMGKNTNNNWFKTNKNSQWTDKFRRFAMPLGTRFYVEPMLRVPIEDNDTSAYHYTALVAVPITVFFDKLGWVQKKYPEEEEMTKMRPPRPPLEAGDDIIDYPTSQQNFAFFGNSGGTHEEGTDEEEQIEEEEHEQTEQNRISKKSKLKNRLYNYNYAKKIDRRRYPRQAEQNFQERDSHDWRYQGRRQSQSQSQGRMEEDDMHEKYYANFDKENYYKEKEHLNVHIHKIVPRSSPSFVLPHNGGERAELIPALEKILNSLGYKGSHCLLRAACEIHEYPLEKGYGLIGEFITMFFSVSRSKFADSHLSNYLQAELDGKNQNCTSYMKNCETSIFRWHS